MFKKFEEDIYSDETEKLYLSFFSDKLRVGIIGGGKAATIKVRSLLKKNIYVELLSRDFTEEILSMKDEKLVIIKSEYNNNFIMDKHLVIIAIDDDELINRIKNECDKAYKLYINCTDFKEGIGLMPVQRKLKNISFGLNTNGGNPKGALLAADIAAESLKNIDDFIGITSILRNNAKALVTYKKEIIDFISSNDFKFFWDKGKDKIVLDLFLNKDDIECLYRCRGEVNGNSYCNKKEHVSSSSS